MGFIVMLRISNVKTAHAAQRERIQRIFLYLSHQTVFIASLPFIAAKKRQCR
jgi:hypothetical protein